MAAANTDYFMKVGKSTATTLSAPGYTVAGTSVNVASTSNWPTDTGVMFAIDEVDSDGARVSGTYNVFRGTVATATQIDNLVYVGGDANRNYSAGATTRVYILVSSDRENRIVNGLVVEHNQDGTHAAITATSVTSDTISEETAANGVTIDSLNIKDGKLNTNNSVVTANITDDAVTPAKRTGGFAIVNFTVSATGSQDVTGGGVNFTPTGVQVIYRLASGSNALGMQGFADGTSQVAQTWTSAGSATSTSHLIAVDNTSNVAQTRAALTAFISGGMTINVTTAASSRDFTAIFTR